MDFDLDNRVRREPASWCFGWTGECVSSPVLYLVHTDRFGVTPGGPFLEVNPSIYHMIEGHALMDGLADWHPVAGNALEAWVAGNLNEGPDGNVADLRLVREASGPCDRWLRSESVTIRQLKVRTDPPPRLTRSYVRLDRRTPC